MLHLNHIQKFYGHFCALADLNMSVSEGALYGFVGPNGACKTTACGNRRRNAHPYITQDQPDGQSGQQYIANLRNGAKFGFRYFDLHAPHISLTTRGDAGTVLVSADFGKTVLAEIPVEASKTWKKSRSVRLDATGVSELCFLYQGSGKLSVSEIHFE